MTLKSPGIETRETVQTGGGSGPALATIAAFVGTAEKGPIGVPVLCRNLTEFVNAFGAATTGYLRRAADAVWAPGNAPGAAAYFVRTAHYTDLAQPNTLTATKASFIFKTTANVDALKFTAKSEGTWGHSIKPKVVPGAGNTFTLEVYQAVDGQDVLIGRTFKDQTLDTIEAAVNADKTCPGTVEALVAAAPMADAQSALAGGDDGLVGLTDADYVGSAAGRTGLNALNTVLGRLLAAIPGVATKVVHDGILAWCATRGSAYAYLDCPTGTDYNGAVTYRTTTLGANSSFGELLWPNLLVDGVEVPLSPYRIAAQIRTDNEVGGAHQVASGALYGTFYGYTEPASDLFKDVEVRNALDQAQVNTLNVIKGAVVFWGANTLDTTGRFPYGNERRVFQDAETRVNESVVIDVFQNNDESLWKSLTRKVRDELLPIWRAGGLRGATEAEAFNIKIDAETNPQDAIDRGEVHGKIGLATNRPGLFFYFDFYRK